MPLRNRRSAALTTDTRLRAWQSRATQLVSVLKDETVDFSNASQQQLIDVLTAKIGMTDSKHVWLILGVLSGNLPNDQQVETTVREARLSGPQSVIEAAFRLTTEESALCDLEIAVGQTIVDVEYIARASVFTGIQRVAVELARHWHKNHDITLVAWNDCKRAMRRLSENEFDNVIGREGQDDPSRITESTATDEDDLPTLVVPWCSTYLLVELPVDLTRLRRLLATARHSANATGAIVFDTVPLTLAETTFEGTPNYFVLNLAMLRHFNCISAISHSTAAEYAAWRTMLSEVGWEGPKIGAVSLPIEPLTPTTDNYELVQRRFTLPDCPMVLCVGSHEPRKNQLAILAAAESLWRSGHQFSLLFVAGNAWREGQFFAELQRLQDAGFPVDNVKQVNDPTLGSLYRIARMTVFPSLAEGFGLPVAESLAAGTPVITSNFGSMAEICAAGGAMLVDPRDDNAIAAAMAKLLEDDELHARLQTESRNTPTRTWEEYAEENWIFFSGELSSDA